MRLIQKSIVKLTALRNLKQYRASNSVSLWFCRSIDTLQIRTFLGMLFAGLAIFSTVIAPRAVWAYNSYQLGNSTQTVYIDTSTLTESAYQWPLTRMILSQKFSSYHPGLDLVSRYGSPVYPIAPGNVLSVIKKPWEGYGNHVIMQHENGSKSLYAHLSKIRVYEGQYIQKTTTLGDVGSTGRSTGNHLHLEMYEKETAVNPLDALPTLPTPGIASEKNAAVGGAK